MAMFGLYDWEGVPTIPPELMLFPSWFYFNIYEMSSWTRAIVVPLSIIWAVRPKVACPAHARLDELFPDARRFIPVKDTLPPHSFFTWTHFFLIADKSLKRLEGRGPHWIREWSLQLAEDWILERLDDSDGLGAIIPGIFNTIMAFKCLGYPDTDPRFREQIAASTTEMVEWHRNHPSIVIWGCLNECNSHKRENRADFARVLRLLKRLDPSRPTTFASCFYDKDLCFDLCDIVSLNRYMGWYHGDITETNGAEAIGLDLRQWLRWLHSPRSRGGAGKPVIFSEFGGAAIYGCRNPGVCQKWSEDYQARLLEAQLDVYLNHPAVSGAAIWQFADCRVTRGHFSTRARTHNNKGTLDEYRRPKLAYDTVRRLMRAAAKRWDRQRA